MGCLPKKEGDRTYSTVNPHNFQPIFTTEQLCASLQLSTLADPVLCAGMIIDTELLHEQIISATSTDLDLQAQVGSNNRWTKDDNGLIQLDGRIFVPDVNNL